jgi:hypothetical protein
MDEKIRRYARAVQKCALTATKAGTFGIYFCYYFCYRFSNVFWRSRGSKNRAATRKRPNTIPHPLATPIPHKTPNKGDYTKKGAKIHLHKHYKQETVFFIDELHLHRSLFFCG